MAQLKINVERTDKRQLLELEAAGSHEDLTAMLAATVEEHTYRTLLPLPNSVIGTAAKVEAALLAQAIKKGMHRAVEEITASKKAGGAE